MAAFPSNQIVHTTTCHITMPLRFPLFLLKSPLSSQYISSRDAGKGTWKPYQPNTFRHTKFVKLPFNNKWSTVSSSDLQNSQTKSCCTPITCLLNIFSLVGILFLMAYQEKASTFGGVFVFQNCLKIKFTSSLLTSILEQWPCYHMYADFEEKIHDPSRVHFHKSSPLFEGLAKRIVS